MFSYCTVVEFGRIRDGMAMTYSADLQTCIKKYTPVTILICRITKNVPEPFTTEY